MTGREHRAARPQLRDGGDGMTQDELLVWLVVVGSVMLVLLTMGPS